MPSTSRFFAGALAALLLPLLLEGSSLPSVASSRGTFLFELSFKGKSWDTGVILAPGVKPPIGKIDDGKIGAVLLGTLQDFAAQFLDLDPSGKYYLYYDGKVSWRVATNTNSQDVTTLTGQVANDGVFWMTGPYTPPNAGSPIGTVFVQGQVKFVKGTFDPASVSGDIWFVAGGNVNSGLELKFKTDGPAVH